MTIDNRLLVGTALCLLMAAPSVARAETGAAVADQPMNEVPVILAQAEETDGGEQEPGTADCPPGTIPTAEGCVAEEPPVEEAPPEEAPTEEAPAEEAPAEEAPAEEAPAEEAPTPEAPPPEAPTPEPSTEEAPAEQPPADEPPAEEAPAQEPAAEEAPVEEPPAEEEAPADSEQPGAASPTPDEPVSEPSPTGEQAPAEQEEPASDEPSAAETESAPVQQEEPAEAETLSEPEAEAPIEGEAQTEPADEQPSDTETTDEEELAPAEADEPAATETQEEEGVTEQCPPGTRMSATASACVPVEDTTEGEPADGEAGTADEMTTPESEAGTAADEEPAEEADQPTDEPASDEVPASEEEAPADTQDTQEGEPVQETPEAAPEAEGEDEVTEPGEPAPDADATGDEQPREGEEAVPDSDQEAQQDVIDPEQVRQEIRALVEEEGQRIELGQTPEDQRVRRRQMYQQPEDVRVIEEYNDNRTIVEVNNNIYVESPDYDRLVRRDDRVYYEELRGGRVREVIERPDGTRVITVRNRYGDILRRVRITPDGREYVLAYVPEDRFDTVRRFEDISVELPPFRLTIPVSEYILEAETVQEPDRFYAFLDQPPVEPVQRLYSLEEVQYSARVRDMVRRVDLDTIEFEFGSARIEEREIADLEALANAMQRLIEENPAETFLIEGHTDAVGSELANLTLSDRRAEAVARGLTDVFGLPPENLVTQGYGEQFLKVDTQDRERLNRRVAVRRITPLVAPVASAQ